MMDFFTVSIFFCLYDALLNCTNDYRSVWLAIYCMINFFDAWTILLYMVNSWAVRCIFFYLMMDFLTMINLSSVWLTFYLQKSFLNVWWTFHLDAELFTCMINFLPVWTFELYNKLLLYGDFLMHEQFYSRMNFLTVLRTF